MKNKKSKIQGELIYGIHPLVEVLKAKRRKVISIYTTKPEPKAWDLIKQSMPKYPVPIQYVKRDILTKMAGTTDHQGIVSWVHSYPFRRKFFDSKKEQFLVMLDGVQDVGNLGAILRSAYCTNVDGVILIKRNAAPLNAAAFKSSAGLAEHLQIYQAASVQEAVQDLKQNGYALYLAMFDGENAAQCQYKQPLCMVIGGEGFGISKNITKSGIHVTLPQKTTDISYNASVAAGILLFLVATQQNKI